jgi:Polyketide cyclase / dehydrase and lipid transport
MATVSSSASIAAPRAEVWRLYFDETSWPAWVDQFAAVVSAVGYPEVGGELVWRSGRAGRGEVREKVLEHVPESRHAIKFTDPSVEGRLVSRFEEEGAATKVSLELTYELISGGLFAAVSDLLFVRSQMRESLARSLAGLRLELGA